MHHVTTLSSARDALSVCSIIKAIIYIHLPARYNFTTYFLQIHSEYSVYHRRRGLRHGRWFRYRRVLSVPVCSISPLLLRRRNSSGGGVIILSQHHVPMLRSRFRTPAVVIAITTSSSSETCRGDQLKHSPCSCVIYLGSFASGHHRIIGIRVGLSWRDGDGFASNNRHVGNESSSSSSFMRRTWLLYE